MDFNSLDEIIARAKDAEGKTFQDFDINQRLFSKRNKGGLGQIIEEGLFGYEVNSSSEADFGDFGVELKVTPIKVNKNKTLSAKERLVLNIINYMEEVNYTFETSSFWRKNEKLLIMFYLWEKELDRKDYQVLKSILFTYPEEDLEVIKNDWAIIVEKIKAGKAEELSEGDTMYLGACTKGATKNSLRVQPYSEVPAMQRAFSLKQSYMTSLVRKHIDQEKIISFTTAGELKNKSLEEILYERFEPYIGKSVLEISKLIRYTINPSNKSTIANMISTMLGITGIKLNDIEEFSKANIEFKTIRLEPNGKPKESMSFEIVDFNRWLSDSFEESQFYEKFEETKFLFIVFQYDETAKENPNRVPYFRKVILWNMPEKIIQSDLKEMWVIGRKVLQEGVKLTPIKRGVSNNLPKSTENQVAHIRPKARNASDTVQLPDGQYITKQAYWLNRNYIAKIINE